MKKSTMQPPEMQRGLDLTAPAPVKPQPAPEPKPEPDEEETADLLTGVMSNEQYPD